MTKIEIITKCSTEKDECIHQGDVITNIDYIEYADIIDGTIEISKITFPKVIVLTQECDSIQYYKNRNECFSLIDKNECENIKTNQFLLSIIVAPLYNLDEIIKGTHLSKLKIIKDNTITDGSLNFDNINTDKRKKLFKNQIDRYHYLKIEINGKFVEYVIDFKHYFTVNTEKIINKKQAGSFFVSINPLFRDAISQRFSNYLSRIGLPEMEINKES